MWFAKKNSKSKMIRKLVTDILFDGIHPCTDPNIVNKSHNSWINANEFVELILWRCEYQRISNQQQFYSNSIQFIHRNTNTHSFSRVKLKMSMLESYAIFWPFATHALCSPNFKKEYKNFKFCRFLFLVSLFLFGVLIQRSCALTHLQLDVCVCVCT